MTYKLTDEQKRGVLSASDDKQYDHFLNRVADWGEVWSLHNGERFAVVRDPDDDSKLLPVWPHPDYARDDMTGGWEDFEPRAIEIHDFLDECARMEKEGRGLAILHQPNGDFLHMPAGVVADDLRTVLESIE